MEQQQQSTLNYSLSFALASKAGGISVSDIFPTQNLAYKQKIVLTNRGRKEGKRT